MTTSGPQPGEPFEPMPSAPPVDPRELTAAPERPKSVRTAFTLWMVMAALSALGVIVTLAIGREPLRDAAEDSLRAANSAVTAADLDAAVDLLYFSSLAFSAVFLVVYLVFPFPMRNGRNWARMVLAVVGVISLLLLVLSLAGGGQTGVNLALTVVQIALMGTAVYFMFTKDSAAFFSAAKRAA